MPPPQRRASLFRHRARWYDREGVADDDGRRLLGAQRPERQAPGRLELRRVRRVDLIERAPVRIAGVTALAPIGVLGGCGRRSEQGAAQQEDHDHRREVDLLHGVTASSRTVQESNGRAPWVRYAGPATVLREPHRRAAGAGHRGRGVKSGKKYMPAAGRSSTAVYWFRRRRRKPSSPWGRKITVSVKITPTGIR